MSLDRLSSFDYYLPPELIAQNPLAKRDRSRLMHVRRADYGIGHHRFYELPELLRKGDLLVINDTRVIPARLIGRKESGGEVEVFLSKPLGEGRWEALVRMSGSSRIGAEIIFKEGRAVFEKRLGDGLWLLRIECEGDPNELIRRIGGIPLPPYIKRNGILDRRERDRERYQTVYAKHDGAVAAPTAGLHFTERVFEKLRVKNVRHVAVTLDVGLGTFQPLRQENLSDIQLHRENYSITALTIETIKKHKRDGGRIVAVGTTTVRVLENVARLDKWYAHSDSTELFLRPGNRFKLVDAIITNFHLPRSSLIILVAAFAGKELIDKAYKSAIAEKYRFYSYGDAMLIE